MGSREACVGVENESKQKMNENATRKPVTLPIKKQNEVYFKFPSFKMAELRDQIVSVQEEKKVLAIELENLKSKLVEAMDEVGTSGLGGKSLVFELTAASGLPKLQTCY